jgi:hypothetical protein
MTTRRRWTTALLAALAATALAGCTVERVGAAAVVDGDPISTERVQDLTQEYLDAVPGADAGQAQRAILQSLVLERVYDRAADRLDVGVSASRVAQETRQLERFVHENALCPEDQTIEECLPGLLAARNTPGVAPSRVADWVRGQVLLEQVTMEINDLSQGEAATEEMAQKTNRRLQRIAAGMDIEVNPRFGRWAGDAVIVPVTSGGLASDVAELEKNS